MTINAKELTKWATMNKAAVAAVEEMAKRERARRETNISLFHGELTEKFGNVDPDQLLSYFKKAEEMGLGALIADPATGASKFRWGYNLKEVALAAKGKKDASELKPEKAWNKPPRKSQPNIVKPIADSFKTWPQQPDIKPEAVDSGTFTVIMIVGKSHDVIEIPGDRVELVTKFLTAMSK